MHTATLKIGVSKVQDFGNFDLSPMVFATHGICINTQLKLSKKQFKLNAFIQKCKSAEQYAFTCYVIVYHWANFFSV